MKLPELRITNASTSMISAFGGYNNNNRISDGEFRHMENMTADEYPLLSPRKRRGILYQLTDCRGLFGTDKLVWVDSNKLYYEQNPVCELPEEYQGRERQFVRMGAYLCVFPDKIMYNTYTGEVEYMEHSVTTTEAPVFTLCKRDGTVFREDKTYTGDTEPDVNAYSYWIDTSENTAVMKVWSENAASWVSVGTCYVKIAAPGIGAGFKEYDAVTLSGVDRSEYIFNDYDFNTSCIVYGVGEDHVIVVGFIDKVFQNSGPITLKRTVPDMDYVTEMDNRIWGCSSVKHEIYACKLGDPKNWNCFMGIASDSYAVTVGSEGNFTGAVSYAGSVLFWKEHGLHRVFGNQPSNFELNWKPMRGVQFGSEKSLIVLNEVLYFKSRDGICAYDGSMPRKVSDQLGNTMYYEAVAGGYRDKYYVCMHDEQYNYKTFVYDTAKGIWVIEDAGIKKAFAYVDGGLYFLDEKEMLWVINQEKIFIPMAPSDTRFGEEVPFPGTLYPGGMPLGESEGVVEWSVTTGDMGLNSPYNKYVRELVMRLEIDTNSLIRLDIMYDSSEAWEKIMEYTATRKRSYQIPVRVKRCDHFRLRISGRGDMKLYSIAQIIEEGSAVSG